MFRTRRRSPGAAGAGLVITLTLASGCSWLPWISPGAPMPQTIDLVEADPRKVESELAKLEAAGLWRVSKSDPAQPLAVTSRTYRDVVAQTSPAVVNVFTQTTVIGSMYSDPLGVFPFQVGIPIPHRGSNLGSGFLIGNSYVVTSRRVIAAAQSIEVQIPGRAKSVSAKVLGAIPSSDVALLGLEGSLSDLASVEIRGSAGVPVGEPVLAIGNPFATGATVREGVVSFRGSRLQRGDDDTDAPAVEFFQTTARIQPGDAGGPLVDLHGAVIGMSVLPEADATKPGAFVPDAGYAVPIDVVKRSIAQILGMPRVPIQLP